MKKTISILFSILITVFSGYAQKDVLSKNTPTEKTIREALSDFSWNNEQANIDEAKLMLEHIGAKLQNEYEDLVIGVFKTGYAISIWDNAYGKTGAYSIRYGKPNAKPHYHSSNDTYFEISKPNSNVFEFKKDYNYFSVYSSKDENWGEWIMGDFSFIFNINTNFDFKFQNNNSGVDLTFKRVGEIEEEKTSSGNTIQIINAFDNNNKACRLIVFDSGDVTFNTEDGIIRFTFSTEKLK